jgi:4-hydroxy-2-oxovalerate aldolase
MTPERDVLITEVSLRDGSHAIAHQFTLEQVVKAVAAMRDAGIPYIEVSHGEGLGGSSLQYGLSRTDEMKLIEAAVSIRGESRISVLVIPGIGTIADMKQAAELGVESVHIGTHVTEADVSAQHIHKAKELGLETIGFLMMSHMAPVGKLVEQAKLMESYGADAVYMYDSAGALLPNQVKERVRALRQHLGIDIGFHGHNNLSLAVANTLVAIEEGARRVDGSIRCFGAGGGNAQTEVLVAVLERMGIKTGINLYRIMDIAEEIISPLMASPPEITRDILILGYAGVYSSFLLHAKRAAKRFGVDTRDILIELGRRKTVGGQEDLIVDIAAELARMQHSAP